MKLTFLLLTTIAASTPGTRSLAQSSDSLPSYEVAFHLLGVNEGLSQGLILGITQDKTGFMWFATKDGLNKYDGYQFTCYRNDPKDAYSLPDNYVTNVVCDSNGNLWVATQTKGIYVFDERKERFYHVPFLGNNDEKHDEEIRIWGIHGNQLLLGDLNGVYLFDVNRIHRWQYAPDSLITFQKLFDSRQNSCHHLSVQMFFYATFFPDGSIGYTNDDTAGMYSPDKKTQEWTHNYFLLRDLNMEVPASSIQQIKGTQQVIINDQTTLAVYDLEKKKLIYRKNDFTQYSSLLFTDPSGKVWMCNGRGYLFDPSSLKLSAIVDRNNVLSGVPFTYGCEFTDRNGSTWIGTNGYGVLHSDPWNVLFKSFADEKFILADTVLLFKESKSHQFTVINPVNNEEHDLLPAGDRIYTTNFPSRYFYIVKDNVGTFWLAFHKDGGKIAAIRNINGKLQSQQATISDTGDYRSIIPDRDNSLWLVRETIKNRAVIFHFDKEEMKITGRYDLPVDYPFDSKAVIDYYEDKSGTFWFANEAGLFRFDPSHRIGNNVWHQWIHHDDDSTSLPTSKITAVRPDPNEPEKYLWLGTNGGGLVRFEISTGRCIHFTNDDGLANNVVCGILKGNSGNLWISTNNGLSCFNPVTHTFRNFSEDDGLPSNEFSLYGAAKSATGELFFDGVKGLTAFEPKNILGEYSIPPIVITGISVFNRPLNWKTDTTALDASPSFAHSLTLPHDQDMFTISFAALEYTDGKKKHYQYRLEGYNNNWIESRTNNQATYTNLPPGSYTFQVKGAGRDNAWNEEGAALNIIILPAWWQTWWFRVLIGAIAVLAVYLFIRYRIRQRMQIQNLRNRIADDLHDEIGSTLSSVSLLSTAAKQTMNQNPTGAENMLAKISDGTVQMMESMSDIVWTIHAKNDRLTEVINRMRAFASEVLETKNASLQMNVREELLSLPLTMLQRKDLYLIFKEAVNNASKYSACKNFLVTISMNGERKLKMILSDDGRGFESTGNSLGGNGLTSMQRRADELKGNLKIESIPSRGTTIVLEFPVK